MKLSLVVMTAGKSKGHAVPINLPQFIIGRDPQCHLRPASAVISKRHCAVLIKDGQVSVRDFDSTNGTFVNDVPVKGEAPLKNEDILKIGPLEFKVAIEAKPPAAKPTPPPPAPKTAAAEAAVATGAAVAAPVPVAAASPPGDDESVAAMLLSLQEDTGTAGEESTSQESSDIPAGSTVMDLAVSPEATSAAAETPLPDAPKPAGPKRPDPKNDPAHLAAKAILEKYSRRTR
jgi:predicted component of type VI protein secretion system